MPESFFFEQVELITVGTLGPKGQREFYLQCKAEGELVSLKMEKQQAQALATYMERMLANITIDAPAEAPDDLDLREPVIESWRIGNMGLAYDHERDIVMLLASELRGQDEDEDDLADGVFGDGAEARFFFSRGQALGLIRRARRAVDAGRPPCPYCRMPLEPENAGWCPCSN